MKILLVTEFYDEAVTDMSGGVEARTHHVAKNLWSLGHQVYVVSRKRHTVAATALSIFPRIWFQFQAIIDGLRHNPRVVEGSNFVCYIPAFIVAKLRRAVAVAWYADVYGDTWFRSMSLPVAIGGFLLEWISLRLPWNTVIAMSQSTKKKLIRAGVAEEKITVIYGGVDCQLIDKIKVKKYGKPTICTAARLVGYKRVDHLIHAFSKVQKKLPEAQLIIMGDGPEKMRLTKLSNTITTQNSVHFLGTLSQVKVWREMKRAHVFCLPSTVEGFGLVTIEAMACGLPYVNADIPVNREITHGGKGGYLYEPGNIEALSQALLDLLTNARLRDQKSRQGSALCKHYEWQLIASQTVQAYSHPHNR
jgi:glycosyltransferase involved in cell wall biosynthesis